MEYFLIKQSYSLNWKDVPEISAVKVKELLNVAQKSNLDISPLNVMENLMHKQYSSWHVA